MPGRSELNAAVRRAGDASAPPHQRHRCNRDGGYENGDSCEGYATSTAPSSPVSNPDRLRAATPITLVALLGHRGLGRAFIGDPLAQ